MTDLCCDRKSNQNQPQLQREPQHLLQVLHPKFRRKVRSHHTQNQRPAASAPLDHLVLLSRTGGAEVKAQTLVSEVQPLKTNQNSSHEEQKAKPNQSSEEPPRPPQERNQVQQSWVEDSETSLSQQVHQSLPPKKKAPPAGDSQRNRDSSSSGLRKTQSVQSLPTSPGKRDRWTRTGVSPDWTGQLTC